MKKTLLILLASAGLAGAELSPENFDKLRSFAVSSGVHYVGVSRLGNCYLYRFNDQNNQPAAFVPMEVVTFDQAVAALHASFGTLILCEREWKRPLEDLRSRIIPPPPEGYSLDDSSQIAGFLMKSSR